MWWASTTTRTFVPRLGDDASPQTALASLQRGSSMLQSAASSLARLVAQSWCELEGLRTRALIVSLWLVVAGCGYRFVVPDSVLPGTPERVRVPVFANDTSEAAADMLFTEATRELLLQAGKLGGEGTPHVLEGLVQSVNFTPVIASPSRRLPNYRLSVGVLLTLKKEGVVVGRAAGVASEDFPAGADVLWLETNKAAALRRAAAVAVRDALDGLGNAAK